jgi:putative intracellular protease/amidase
MKKTLIVLALFAATPADASPTLAICHNPYALCASSATVAVPGKTVTVNGKVFPMGVSVCPVLKGASIAAWHIWANWRHGRFRPNHCR